MNTIPRLFTLLGLALTPPLAHAFTDDPTIPIENQKWGGAKIENSRDPNPVFINKLDNSMRQHAALTRFRNFVPNSALGQHSFAAILQTIQSRTGLTLTVDWDALNDAGLDAETPLSIPAKNQNLSCEKYLAAACNAAGVSLVLAFDNDRFTLTTRNASTPDDSPPPIKRSGLVPNPTENLDSPADRALLHRLNEPVTLTAHNDSLEKTMDSLRNSTNLNFNINWRALESSGVDSHTPASIDLHNAPLNKTLTTLLENVGGGAANLGYTVHQGVITVSTKDDLNSAKYQVVRTFDIRSLANPHSNRYDDQVKNLVDTIKTTIAPDSWRDAGGQIGSVRELNGLLIITQTQDNQRAVATLLQQLASHRR